MNDLQAVVARAADRAGSHSTAPALLLQATAALGRLAELANAATEGGRRPFRIPPDWQPGLSELAYLVYLLADQTARRHRLGGALDGLPGQRGQPSANRGCDQAPPAAGSPSDG